MCFLQTRTWYRGVGLEQKEVGVQDWRWPARTAAGRGFKHSWLENPCSSREKSNKASIAPLALSTIDSKAISRELLGPARRAQKTVREL